MGAGALLPLLKPEEKAPTPLCSPAVFTGTSASAACVFSRPDTSCAPAGTGARALVMCARFITAPVQVEAGVHLGWAWQPPS